MGHVFRSVGKHLDQSSYPGDTILEIGSDRYEGSSYYFADLATCHDMKFITIDLDVSAIQRSRKNIPTEWHDHCEFVVGDGAEWTKRVLPELNPTIRIVYLDNFDWDWETEKHSDMIEQQKAWYKKRNIQMTNLNSQVSHLTQMINIMPYLAPKCIVCVDDTYDYKGVFIGKGGAVVPYLLSNGFGMLEYHSHTVILGRGYTNYIV